MIEEEVLRNKKCAKCKMEKPISNFHRNKNRKDGLKPYCKECIADYYNEKKDEIKIYKDNWYIENREHLLEKAKLYQKENAEKIKEYKKTYYKINKELCNTQSKNNRLLYRKRNLESVKKKQNEQAKKWRENNKHIVAWRSLLRSSLRRMGKSKESSTIHLLGYSVLDFKQHIENLWTPGMSWENHGQWHIDHIKPVSSFEPETHPNVVNSLSNLRPLWATNRIIDGVFYEGNLNKGNR